jgi:predicted MFS family arabinose efflux permease
MNLGRLKNLSAAAMLALVLCPHSLWACAACAGQSDSPMAKGMNWGIMSLLAVVACVLGGITTFFVYIGKRSQTDKMP